MSAVLPTPPEPSSPAAEPLRLSTVILPVHRWPTEGRRHWRRAEELGFHTAYTYDHLSWRSFRNGPWYGAIPTLTAAATATTRLRLGTLVTSPNFRHPVTLAKELITLDDVSEGRVTVGIGSGGTGFDATALGQDTWTPRERADRFAEFVRLLDRLLSEGGPGGVSYTGDYYSAHEVRNVPGCVQRPRLPFAVAATGPRGMRLAARHGQAWVTTGDPAAADAGPRAALRALARQVDQLSAICEEAGREPAALGKILLTGFTPHRPLESVDAFVELAGGALAAGFTELVVHWPVPDSLFAGDQKVFERIVSDGLPQLIS
ncbi:LLM class flavin-dependent oxidoreductase [Streptomyces aidingensis]|uniref:Luciferase-like monooxygenase n=1 Tax=Streptomyces aidingensis TaxID=910347 RepID=A0A1I1QFL4_9ACTN|nr:LLM class flavin-dependent oxidoreductase [Streptomyces aidingensis]SFD20792.1 Luciferase-like monooxygenase [Streptomyces aidingensis]